MTQQRGGTKRSSWLTFRRRLLLVRQWRIPAGRAMLVPGAFLVLNLIESNLVTPAIYGNRMRLNTVALFIGLVFWWYIWGVPGAILAVPMMAAFKIACDHIESLSPIGEFLGK